MSGSEAQADVPVVVAGAGPTGMTAALALHARGVDVTILEADPKDRERPGSRAIYVHKDTLRTLENASPGLGHRLVDNGMIWSTRRTLFRGTEVFERTYSTPGGDGDLPHFTSLPQVWTEEYMLDAVEDAGIDVHWGDGVETVDASEDVVRVETKSGEEYHAEYVVGADGAGSTVRKEIGGEFDGTESANSFIIADIAEFEDEDEQLFKERVFHYDHPRVDGRNVLLVPFQGGWRVDIQCKDSDDPQRLTEDDAISELVAETLGEDYRDRVEWVSQYKFKQVIADRMVDDHDRVLLAGESGHLFAPFGARGMNSGVADAEAAASAIAVALNAEVESARAAEITQYGITRLKAAEYNKSAAGQALEYLQGDSYVTRAKKYLAAKAAPYYEPAGEWLDDAPYGPHGGPPVTIGQY
ncbi:FAD-dependent oxidoreductase (homolog to geranylgeranyl reductase) [Halobacterium hubeiense]|uniref:FAD-dependent oxidoreductase (Homolog to geranylgeranyl reductase) n=1 Tax=Halobacterium hubeiense TaxID=1407499 RepID=A0A0U5AEM8_9EURY|nr:FAD-dependent monooxygenase [Halobacterium hubeiense]CQH56870.1 FAD-dependent oxidoreductase (homolog to geranylgeranyl reductase) [Halobacterium hubeiense]